MEFFYCASGPEGDPVLVIQPRLSESEIQAIKHGARLKTFARGHVTPGSKGLVFTLSGDERELLEVDLKRYFSKKVSALQNARVVTRPQKTPARAD